MSAHRYQGMLYLCLTLIIYQRKALRVTVYLLRLRLLCGQAEYEHHHQREKGQHGGEVQVVHLLQHRRPDVLLEAQRRRVHKVQHHADEAHRQADGEAPECTLGASGRTRPLNNESFIKQLDDDHDVAKAKAPTTLDHDRSVTTTQCLNQVADGQWTNQ